MYMRFPIGSLFSDCRCNALGSTGLCDDIGKCTCTGHWAGPKCNNCQLGWTHSSTGEDCSVCATGYTGSNCDECDLGYGGDYCKSK